MSKRTGRNADINAAIGANVRRLRVAAGFTQARAAAALGVTFQQFHKYETATNRIPASDLFRLTKILSVTLDDLIGGDGDATAAGGVHDRSLTELMVAARKMDHERRLLLLGYARLLAHPASEAA